MESLFSFLWAILGFKKGQKREPGSECHGVRLLAAEAVGQHCIFVCGLAIHHAFAYLVSRRAECMRSTVSAWLLRGGDGTERQRGHMVKAFESALGNVNDLFKPPFTI